MPRWCFVSYFFFHWHSCEKNLIDGKIKCFYNWRIVSLTFYFFVYFVFRLIACFYDENKRTSWLVLTDQDSFFFLFLNRVLECNLWIASEKNDIFSSRLRVLAGVVRGSAWYLFQEPQGFKDKELGFAFHFEDWKLSWDR